MLPRLRRVTPQSVHHDATAHSMQTAQITRPSVTMVSKSELSD